MTSPRPHGIHDDRVDNVLDRLSEIREELHAIERSLERMQAAKLEQGKVSDKKSRIP